MSRTAYTAILIVCVTVLAGCNEPIDLTKDSFVDWPVCQVHQCQMRPEHIDVAGEIVYYPEYSTICQEQFPNHGNHRFNGEKEGTPYNKDVIDFVCYKCNHAYEQYWKDRNNKLSQ